MLDLRIFTLGPLQTNCYVVSQGGQALVIDPGGEPSVVVAYLEKSNLRLAHILNTHFHFDHIQGNAALHRATGAVVQASPVDAFLLDNEIGGGGFMGFPRVEAFAYEPVAAGERTYLGQRCQVLAIPGHSPGSLGFYFPESGMLFGGDLIFYHSIGRTDFPGGDHSSLLLSVRTKIFSLPNDTVIYSGHGPSTTVGEEKAHNPFFNPGFLL